MGVWWQSPNGNVLAPLTPYYGKPSIRDISVQTLWGDPPPYSAPQAPLPPPTLAEQPAPEEAGAAVVEQKEALDSSVVILVIVLAGVVGLMCTGTVLLFIYSMRKAGEAKKRLKRCA